MHRDVLNLLGRWLIAGAAAVVGTATLASARPRLGGLDLGEPVNAAAAGLIVLLALGPWRQMTRWSAQRDELRRLAAELRDVGSGRRAQPRRGAASDRGDEIGRLSRAVHETLAHLVALRIEAHALNRNLHQHVERETTRATARLTRQAFTDALTGLGNRRLLDQRLGELRTATKSGQSVNISMLLLDLDHFKRINDRLGHEVGDQCLAEVGRVLGSCLRQTDVAARLGGDEFIVVLDEAGSAQARRIAERIAALVRQLPWSHPAEYRPTLSIGLADGAISPGLDPDVLVRHADAALYHSKRHGRDRITTYADIAAAA